MYKHVLIPTDGSERSDRAVHHGTELSKAIGAKVTLLTVSAPLYMFTADPQVIQDTASQYTKRVQHHTDAILSAAAQVARAAGVPWETVHVEHEHPYWAIIDTATSKGCDIIVMASHGRHGPSAIVLGSETVKVLTHCKIPVLVYR